MADDGCLRVYALSGKNDLMGKVFGLFMDMDKMDGKDFEDGLANLEGVVTGKAAEQLPACLVPAVAGSCGRLPSRRTKPAR